jgi:succinate-semialdehyde dehydrogenase/glutarate-semialdehyde dehydrogenase
MTQESINPATGETIARYPLHDKAFVQQAIANGHAAFLHWRQQSIKTRADALLAIAERLQQNKQEYATLIAKEMGKPLLEAIAEVEKCASCARYFAQNGEVFLADQPVETEHYKSYVAYRPMGIVLGVMPWNFPFWQAFRYILPSLMAGNVCLLKHASNTPGCALAIAQVCRDAGLPEHAVQALLIPGSRVEEVVSHPYVTAVTLTGSTPAGRAVAELSGRYLKKTVMELGGSDPYLILESADVAHAIKTCAASRGNNCGQSCVSAKRMIVVDRHRAAFEKGMVEAFGKIRIGDPMDANTTMGPMSRADLRDELHDQVQRSIAAGATCLLGGKVPAGKGAFYEPTVLTGVTSAMPAYHEEMFGPVVVIIPARDDEDAIRIANDTVFGLGGAVFSTDLAYGEQVARERIDSGLCFVNMMIRSDPRLPFGGIKESGYGRELAAFGMREFVNIKTIVVAKP